MRHSYSFTHEPLWVVVVTRTPPDVATKKIVSNSPGLEDFAIRPVNDVLNFANG